MDIGNNLFEVAVVPTVTLLVASPTSVFADASARSTQLTRSVPEVALPRADFSLLDARPEETEQK